MLKRFYSKRSGFTLVEIIIAFAVFAIMASMICQILQLSVAARNSNNIYQRELAEQEAILTVIEKQNGDFKSEAGKIELNFGSSSVEIPYAMISAKDGSYSGEGLNYFVANVNYGASGEIPIDPEGEESTTNNTGSQASRMDTRITGTGGIGFVKVWDVVKDTHSYAPGDPYAVPAGHTRYYISVSASSVEQGATEATLQKEDIPYSQYRLYFYDDVSLNAAASKVSYKDGTKKYTKDVHQALKITDIGYLSTKDFTKLVNDGLNSSVIQDTYGKSNNKYTIESMGNNCVRIGSPFRTDAGEAASGMNGRGVKFEVGETSRFYIEFENVEVPVLKADGTPETNPDGSVKMELSDVTLTAASFGYNGVDSSGTVNYAACPIYLDKYDSDGVPEYKTESGKKYVNIYGAYLYTRHYGEGGDS